MKCEEIETLMADALGDELANKDRESFEAHLLACQRCRQDFESALATVRRMQSLPDVNRIAFGFDVETDTTGGLRQETQLRIRRGRMASLLRLAASVFIAFALGVLAQARFAPLSSLGAGDAASVETRREIMNSAASVAVNDGTVQAALAGAHRMFPSRNNLANCLTAVLGVSR